MSDPKQPENMNLFELKQLAKRFAVREKEAESIYILSRCVPRIYRPKGKVLSMAVGCGHDNLEGAITRSLHELIIGTPGFVTTAGCDIKTRISVNDTYNYGDFDIDLQNQVSGDASTIRPWNSALEQYAQLHKPKAIHSSNSKFAGRMRLQKKGFDFILFNRLKMDKMIKPGTIYERACDFLESGGVIATVIDQPKYVTMLTTIYNTNLRNKKIKGAKKIFYKKRIDSQQRDILSCILLYK